MNTINEDLKKDMSGDEINSSSLTNINREPSLDTETRTIAIPARFAIQGFNVDNIRKVITEYGTRIKHLPISKSSDIISSMLPEDMKKTKGFIFSRFGVTIQRQDYNESFSQVTDLFNYIGLGYEINSDTSGIDINIKLDLNS